MDPTSRSTDPAPNTETVRRLGWSVKSAAGTYCVAWRGQDEVVLVWRDGRWVRVNGGELPAAA